MNNHYIIVKDYQEIKNKNSKCNYNYYEQIRNYDKTAGLKRGQNMKLS